MPSSPAPPAQLARGPVPSGAEGDRSNRSIGGVDPSTRG